MKNLKHTNRLANESSPYLLQHAHNPVDWHPWNEETLAKAKTTDRMMLVSIGYSACHWCHVMERESFEDEEVAAVMNANFICIKVDREERPDVDQVYMDAVQLINGHGGWPLNCFALPDGKPVWGGTYFRRDQWFSILENVARLFKKERKKLEHQAEEVFGGILKNPFVIPAGKDPIPHDTQDAVSVAGPLLQKIDNENGGFRGAPKFPMPNNFLFLLRYHFYTKDTKALAAVERTLEKMARGGIYDQVGGGFARYSVDDHWHIPHFEKMLYDNAQLVSLYAEAYRITGNSLFEEVIRHTLDFINRELTSPEGGFFSSLDADSEGVEGKFYVWNQEEFNKALGEEATVLSRFYGMGKEAAWENDEHVLVRAMTAAGLAREFGMPESKIREIIDSGRQRLFMARAARTRPGLDDKVLTSWNALMIKGYIDAYRATGSRDYLNTAIRNARFLKKNMVCADGKVIRSYKNGVVTIDGFLDDYSFLIEAFIALYEVTLDEEWILTAHKLARFTIGHFYDSGSGLFYYTSDFQKDSVARKLELTDNVVPSSSSSMARGLHSLGLLFEEHSYTEMAEKMLKSILQNMQRFPGAFSNWGVLYLSLIHPFHTVVITGPSSSEFLIKLLKPYWPGVLFAGGAMPSTVPVCKNRFDPDKTRVYVCTGSECLLPVESVGETIRLLERTGIRDD